MSAFAKFPMDVPTGETIDFNGNKIVCKKGIECSMCYFNGHIFCNYIACSPDEREDGNDVHFEMLVKLVENNYVNTAEL